MRKAATVLPFVAPAHLLVLGMIVIPSIYIVWLSLTHSTFGRAPTFVGLANYARVLSDPYFWQALGNTVVIVLVAVHVELLLGLGMALLFASGLPARTLMPTPSRRRLPTARRWRRPRR